MKKVSITQEDIANAAQFLKTLQYRTTAKQYLDAHNLAQKLQLPVYSFVGKALNDLKWQRSIGHNKTALVLMTNITPYHGRKLIEKMLYLKKESTKKRKQSPKKEIVIKKELVRLKKDLPAEIEFVGKLTVVNSTIELAGYRISGNFSITKL